jgi:protein TonB
MFLIIIFIAALAIFLFSMDISWSNVLSGDRNDLVFEGRNQQYGAYKLRREHHVNLMIALFLSVGVIGGGMALLGQFVKHGGKITPPQSNISIIPFTIQPEEIEKKPEQEEKEETQKKAEPSEPAGGEEHREVTVVENGSTKSAKSDEDLTRKQIGDGGEGPDGPIAPIITGGGGDGTGLDDEEGGKKKKVHSFVKNRPEFPGGDEALMAYMLSQVRYSEMDKELLVQGTIYLTFIVETDGSISDVKISRNIRHGDRMGKQAIKAIENMPTWKPGNDGEEPLRVLMTLPLKVELRN